MACADTKIEEAREVVRRALQAADSGNQAGEIAVLRMSATLQAAAAMDRFKLTLERASGALALAAASTATHHGSGEGL